MHRIKSYSIFTARQTDAHFASLCAQVRFFSIWIFIPFTKLHSFVRFAHSLTLFVKDNCSIFIQVRLITYATFDSFMLQARGQLLPDGNASYVGDFVKIPNVAQFMTCGNSTTSSVVDKGSSIARSGH